MRFKVREAIDMWILIPLKPQEFVCQATHAQVLHSIYSVQVLEGCSINPLQVSSINEHTNHLTPWVTVIHYIFFS